MNIEIKFPSEGFTTLANIGLWVFKLLTKNGSNLPSFIQFIEDKGYYAQKLSIVKMEQNSSKKSFVNKCRSIRKKSDKKSFSETDEGKKIHQIDKKCKQEYMRLIFDNLNDLSVISKLCSALTNGCHTHKAIDNFLNGKKNNDKYFLLELNYCDNEQKVCGEIKEMTNSNHKIIESKLNDSGLSLEFKTETNDTFEFRLHWKNVGQGVSTPCVMVWKC